MSSDKFFQNLASVLGFLRNNPDNGYFAEEIASETKINKTDVDEVIRNSRANGWVDVDHFTDDGTPAVKINPFGNRKYNTLTGNETSLPIKPKEVHFIHVPQSAFGRIATICSIIGIPLAIFFGLGGMSIFDGPDASINEPEINVTDLNAQDGIVEGNKLVYSYEPRSLTPNGTKNEIFSLKVSNTGNANAHDFWIIIDSKPDGLWFDFQSSAIIHEGNPTPCQQKSSYCTIGLIPKESSNMIVEYNVAFDHKLIQEIVDETPKLFFNYGFDEGKEQTIEVQLKFD